MRHFLLLLVVTAGCQTRSPARVLQAGLHAAAEGDPAAWDICLDLDVGDGRGLCKVAASVNMPDRAGACASIVREYWRGECWFVYAEDLAKAGDWEQAIFACHQTELFANDCGRHLWAAAVVAGAPPEVTTRVLASFPLANQLGASTVAALNDEATLSAQARAQDAAVADEALVRGYEHDFVAARTIDLSACPLVDQARCVEVGRRVFRDRWGAAASHPGTLATLCEGGSPAPRLDPHDDPRLVADLDAFRAERCGASVVATSPTPR